MNDENDDYYREEGAWRRYTTHRLLLTSKIAELRFALLRAMKKLDDAGLMDEDFAAECESALKFDDDEE